MASAGLHGENTQLGHIPGTDGWPIVGHTFDFFDRIYDLGAQLHDRYGEVYRNRAFLMRFVTLASPEGAEFVLRDPTANFSNKLGWEPFLKRIYPDMLQTMDFAEHRYHRQVMQSVFTPAAMEGYSDIVNRTVESGIADWASRDARPIFGKLHALTLAMAAQAFLGLDLQGDARRIMRHYHTLDRGIGALVPYPVPGLSLWRSLRARREIVSYFRPLIAQRRASQARDLFTRLCQSVDEHGATLSDDAILSHMLGMLRAASATTSGSLAVALHHIARDPRLQQRLREQSMRAGSGPISLSALQTLQAHEHVFFEAMRICPVAPQLFRRSLRDCEFKGHKIPAGTQVVVDVGYILRSPRYWDNPMRFEPERFAEPRLEHKRHRYQWLPFGAGSHVCIGQFFALMFAKNVLHQLLGRYRLELADKRALELKILPATYPKDGLRLRIQALS